MLKYIQTFDWSLILKYVQALAWPVVAMTTILIFRSHLIALLSRIKSADLPGGVSINFEQDLSLAQKLSQTLQPPKEKADMPSIPLTEANARLLSLDLQPSPSGLDFTYYRNLAQQDPNLALAGLRIELEVIVRNLSIGWRVKTSNNDSVNVLLRKLLDANAIDKNQFELAMQVVKLCNAAVHGTKIFKKDADAVIDIGNILAEQYIAWLSWGYPDGWMPKNSS